MNISAQIVTLPAASREGGSSSGGHPGDSVQAPTGSVSVHLRAGSHRLESARDPVLQESRWSAELAGGHEMSLAWMPVDSRKISLPRSSGQKSAFFGFRPSGIGRRLDPRLNTFTRIGKEENP